MSLGTELCVPGSTQAETISGSVQCCNLRISRRLLTE